jgi:mannose-1-phosphate guanylyltransferase
MVDEVRRVMGDGAEWGVRLRYAVEPEPLGTGGGVRNAVDLVGGLVAVLNGDVLTDADLGAMLRFHADRQAAATIYLIPVPDPTPYGLVELGDRGRVRRFVEKPTRDQITTNTINAGIYLIERELLTRIDAGRAVSIEREFFPGLLADAVPFFGWVSDQYWMDIGSPAKYRQAQLDLMAKRVASRIAPAPWLAGRPDAIDAAPTASVLCPSVIGAGTRLGPGCRVGPEAVLGPGCTVGAEAVVEGAIVWERVDVGPGAVLRDCIVATGARIGRGAAVEPGAVVAAGDTVPDGARRSA